MVKLIPETLSFSRPLRLYLVGQLPDSNLSQMNKQLALLNFLKISTEKTEVDDLDG